MAMILSIHNKDIASRMGAFRYLSGSKSMEEAVGKLLDRANVQRPYSDA